MGFLGSSVDFIRNLLGYVLISANATTRFSVMSACTLLRYSADMNASVGGTSKISMRLNSLAFPAIAASISHCVIGGEIKAKILCTMVSSK